jgi:hypothetical protein
MNDPLAVPISFVVFTAGQRKSRRTKAVRLDKREWELSSREKTPRLAGKLATLHYNFNDKRVLEWTI